MSPEQATGEGAGPASDVYSLGADPLRALGGLQPGQRRHARRHRPRDRRAGRVPLRGPAGAAAGALRGDRRLPRARPRATAPALDDAARGAGRDARRAPSRPRGPRAGRDARRDDAAARPARAALRGAARPPARSAGVGMLAGLPGLAIVAAALIAPAALLPARPSEWLLPALAPAARRDRRRPRLPRGRRPPRERPPPAPRSAALAWAWTGDRRRDPRPLARRRRPDRRRRRAGPPRARRHRLRARPARHARGDRGRADLGRRRGPARRSCSTRPAPAGAAIGGLLWTAGVVARARRRPARAPSRPPLLTPGPRDRRRLGDLGSRTAARPRPGCLSRRAEPGRAAVRHAATRLEPAPRRRERPATRPPRPWPDERIRATRAANQARARGPSRGRYHGPGCRSIPVRPGLPAGESPAVRERISHECSTQSRSADRGARRGRLQPCLLVAGPARRDRPQARQGDGLPQDRLGLAGLRAEQLHGLALARGPRAARGLHPLALPGALRLPARARPPPGLRAAHPPRGGDRGRRPPSPRRVRDPAAPRQAAGAPGRLRRAGPAGPHDGLLGRPEEGQEAARAAASRPRR